jgi:hypothetical protein
MAMKIIILNCPSCDQKIEAPAAIAGQTLICPTCSSELPCPSRSLTKYLAITAILALLLTFSVAVTWAVRKSGPSQPQKVESVSASGPRPGKSTSTIEGMFGLKLGEPLPPGCTEIERTNESGSIRVTLVPPQTNSVFENYSVCLNPTNQTIVSIFAMHSSYDYDEREASKIASRALVDALELRYGKASTYRNDYATDWNWENAGHNISFSVTPSWLLSMQCSDPTIARQLKQEWDKTQRSKVDTKGL